MLFKRFRRGKGRSRRGDLGPSIVTSDVVIDGNLVSGGDLQIDGTINGDVRGLTVVVDYNGVVHGEVTAEEVVVRGRVIGHIRGNHVHIFSGGHVEGDIVNETISIDHGAYIDGKIHRVDDPLGPESDDFDADEDVLPIRPRRLAGPGEEPPFPEDELARRPKAAE